MYEPLGGGPPRQGSAFTTTSLTLLRRTYRVIVEAIRATHETVDAQFSEDGRGDEIYVASLAQRFDRTNSVLVETYPTVISAVHGDVSSWPPPQRVKAGTASGYGGVRSGDAINPVLGEPAPGAAGWPLLVLWEGDLADGRDDLVLRPVIWELDESNYLARRLSGPCVNNFCAWYHFLTDITVRSVPLPAVKAAIAGPAISIVEGERIWFSSGVIAHMERQDADRPIGLEVVPNMDPSRGVAGWLLDRLVVLSREKIEAALAAGTTTIEMRVWDHFDMPPAPRTAVPNMAGDYTLVMRIERVP
jgi:hypothetical protein